MRKAIKKLKPKKVPVIVAHLMIRNGDGQMKKADIPNLKYWGVNTDKLIKAHKKYGLRELIVVVK